MHYNMTTKSQIQQGEAILKTYNEYLEKTANLKKYGTDKESIEFILEMQELEFKDRIRGIESKLNKLKQDYVLEFEQMSAESNSKMEPLLYDVSKWIDKEPIGITHKIKPLIDLYDSGKEFMDQEKKNEIYFELKGHLNFLKNTYQKK